MTAYVYAEILLQKQKQSLANFTAIPQRSFSLPRLLDRNRKYWIKSLNEVTTPKKLLFADFFARNWTINKRLDLIKVFKQALKDGFSIDIWQGGRFASVTEDSIDFMFLADDILNNITPASEEEIIDAAFEFMPGVTFDELHVVNNYWTNYFVRGCGKEPLAQYILHSSDLPAKLTHLKDAIDLINPVPDRILIDEYPYDIEKINMYLPHIPQFFSSNLLCLSLPPVRNLQIFRSERNVEINNFSYSLQSLLGQQVIKISGDSRLTCLDNLLEARKRWHATRKYIFKNNIEQLSLEVKADIESVTTQQYTELRAIKLSGSSRYHISEAAFLSYFGGAEQLEVLDINGINIHRIDTPLNFPKLKVVKLPENITGGSLDNLLVSSHEIRELDCSLLPPENIKSLNLSKLQKLRYAAKGRLCFLGAERLRNVLCKTPVLTHLYIDFQKINHSTPLEMQQISLPHLKEIKIIHHYYIEEITAIIRDCELLEEVQITCFHVDTHTRSSNYIELSRAFARNIAKNPNIHTLDLPALFDDESNLSILESCNQLECVSIDLSSPKGRTLDELRLLEALRKSTKLKKLNLRAARLIRSGVLTNTYPAFPNLKEVAIDHCDLSRNFLSAILHNVEVLYISHLTYEIASTEMQYLKILKLSSRYYLTDELCQQLLTNIPPSARIQGSFNPAGLSSDTVKRLITYGAVPSVNTQAINSEPQIAAESPVPSAKPPGMQRPNAKHEHKASPPPPPAYSAATVDADTSFDPNKKFSVKNTFFPVDGGSPEISSTNTRLDIYQTLTVTETPCALNAVFTLQRSGDIGLREPNPAISLTQTNQFFNEAKASPTIPNCNKVYAKHTFKLNQNWQAMPSLSAAETITQVNTQDPRIQIRYSARDNLYYIKSEVPQEFDLEWLVTVPTPPPRQLPSELEVIIEKYTKFGIGALDIPEDTILTGYDYLNLLNTQEKGSCRHRSCAFKQYMDREFPQYPTRIVSNHAHMYVEVLADDVWHSIDLGGYPAELEEDKSFSPHASQSAAEEKTPSEDQGFAEEKSSSANQRAADEEVSTLTTSDIVSETQPENPYAARLETWLRSQTPSTYPTTYFNELLRPSTNKLIELNSSQETARLGIGLENYCRQTGVPVFYIDEPDDVRCSAPYFQTTHINTELNTLIGTLKKGPGGLLHNFLTENISHHAVLIINYDTFNADDIVRLNSLLDKRRRADSTAIPSNTTVVGILNVNKPNCYQGSDFYSRFTQVTGCALDTNSLIADLQVVEKVAELEQEPPCINLYNSNNWYAELVGHWGMQNGKFHFQKGPLLTAIEAGATRVNIKNGPWHDPKFVRFWYSLHINQELRFADQVISVPEGFCCIKKSHEQYDWDALTSSVSEVNYTPTPESHVLNPSLLSKLYTGYVCNNALGSLEKTKGLIELVKESPTKDLTIHVTRDLNANEWARLLDSTKDIRLKIECDPWVTLPWSPKNSPAFESITFNPEQIASEKTSVLSSNDVDVTTHDLLQKLPDAIVIDVSEMGPTDLLTSILHKYNKEQLTFKFHQKDCALLKLLAANKKVILKGDFSDELLDVLLEFIKKRFQDTEALGKLIVIQDSLTAKTILSPTQHNVTAAMKLDRLQLDTTPENERQAANESFIRLQTKASQTNPWQGIDKLPTRTRYAELRLDESAAIAEEFDRQRLKNVKAKLRKHPYVFLTGLTAVGKTTFVEKQINGKYGKLYQEEKSIKSWAQDRTPGKKVLFIDEANLSHSDWGNFRGLFNKPPYIIIDGTFYPLTKQHKVIFAGNPLNYGDERKLAKLFHDYGGALVFNPIPLEYIFERILKPVLVGTEIEAKSKEVSQVWLDVYAYLCSKSDREILISARELQMMAMLTVSYCHNNPATDPVTVARFYAYSIAQNLVPSIHQESFNRDFRKPEPLPRASLTIDTPEFVITPSRTPLVNQLQDLITLQEYKQRTDVALTDEQRFGGLGGMVIEGESGIGKSELVYEYLQSAGFAETHYSRKINYTQKRFYRVAVDMDMSQKIKLLYKAFHEGSVVVIDEINSSPMMERLLNSLLMGKTPKGRRPNKPGFMVIGTQNPVKLAGRRAPSNAQARRLLKVVLPQYPEQEIIEILAKKIGTANATLLTQAFKEKYTFAKQNNLKPLPTFRDAVEIANTDAEIQYTPQVLAVDDEEIDEEWLEEFEDNDEGYTDDEFSDSDAELELFDEKESVSYSEEEEEALTPSTESSTSIYRSTAEQRAPSDNAFLLHSPVTTSTTTSRPQSSANIGETRRGQTNIHTLFESNLSPQSSDHYNRDVPTRFASNSLQNSSVNSQRLVPISAPSLRTNWSFYFFTICKAIFAIATILAIFAAINIFIDPTAVLGPVATSIATAMLIKVAPTILGIIYTSIGVGSGLITAGLFTCTQLTKENLNTPASTEFLYNTTNLT